MRREVEEKVREIAAENNGELTPELILEEAKNNNSPLHGEFTWDNNEAAHKWRIEQARTLIRSVKVTVIHDHQEIKTVEFVRDPRVEPSKQGYISIRKLKTDEEVAREAILSESVRVRSTLRRMQKMASFLGLDAEFDSLIQRISEIHGRLEV